MRILLAFTLAFAPALFAQTAPSELFGVWKADLKASKFAGHAPKQYLEIIESKNIIVDRKTKETAPAIEELSGIWSEHGQERERREFILGKPLIRPYLGIPARYTASWQGNRLDLVSEVPGGPITNHRTYTLSTDSKTLTIEAISSGMGPEQHNIYVLLKQSAGAGEPLRQPEEIAGKALKNVKTDQLKALPISEFISRMHYYSWALSKNCEFCHVHGHFDSDDKKEKKTAREMIAMTDGINQKTFEGKEEVHCFTCHEFHTHPLPRALFSDEAQKLKDGESKNPHALFKTPGTEPPSAKPE